MRAGRRAPMGRRFDDAVYALVRRVPPGRVVTYGQVAALLGAPRAARAVGQALHRCPPGVPWHRVVNRRGGISKRPNASSMLSQRLLLLREGVRFGQGRVDLARYGWAKARPRVDVDRSSACVTGAEKAARRAHAAGAALPTA